MFLRIKLGLVVVTVTIPILLLLRLALAFDVIFGTRFALAIWYILLGIIPEVLGWDWGRCSVSC
jgi:hypothetical protein